MATLATDRAPAAARRARHGQVLGVGAPGRRRSPVARPCWSRAPRARRRRRSATAGTTPGCSPRARRRGGSGAVAGDDGDGDGRIARIEELTRIASDVQDALITVLSEKMLPVPELGREVQARQGLQRDRHRQRPRPRRQRAVVGAAAPVQHRGAAVAGRSSRTRSGSSAAGSPSCRRALELPEVPTAEDEIRRVVTVFRELRSGVTGRRPDRRQVPVGAPCRPPRRSR